MEKRISFRLDAETSRILHELQKRSGNSKSEVIRSALRSYWRTVKEESGPTAWVKQESRPTSWEIYQRLYPLLPRPRKGEPLHDRARNASRLIKERLLAKRRNGTL